MNEDDWFAKAARDAEASERGQEAAGRAERKRQNEARAAALTPPPRPREAATAAAVFGAVASGRAGMLGSGYTPDGYSRGGGGLVTSGGVIIDPTEPQSSLRPPQQSKPTPPTPEQGLEAILKAVREAGDADAVMKAAGEWITKVTNGITEVVKESDDDQ